MKLQTQSLIPPGAYGFAVRAPGGWAIYDKDHAPLDLTIPNSGELDVLGRDEYRLLGMEDGMSRVIRFSDLHRHSDNSLQDGMSTVKEIVEATEYSGALTDHGNMYGFVEYYKSMKAAGKKPIIGFEGYMESHDGALDARHIILLAKNEAGYRNIVRLTSEAFDHFHYKPQITWQMLEQYHEGVICLSACLAGAIPTALLKEGQAAAAELVERFIGIFGKEDFYIELQNHGIPDEDLARPQLIQLATRYGLKTAATTDSHYPKPDDREVHDVLLCLQTGKTISDEARMRYEGDGYYLHTSEDMEARFRDFPEALDTTLEIAEKCDVTLSLGEVHLPQYDIPAPFASMDEYMTHIAEKGYQERFGGTPLEHDPEYRTRFDYEINMIRQMGFPGYFIIVWDFINWAKEHNIYVGPGRGSAAGSLVAYCMGITNLDPIKYKLLFERFLNPERVSMPDIDTDIEYAGRPEVIQYMIKKYGANNVCRIITFGTFAARQGIKDVARVLDQPAAYGALLASKVPTGPGLTIKDAFESSVDFKETYELDPMAKRIVNIAMRLEGRKRHSSQHACFSEDTLITTSEGLKKIVDIRPGDHVLTHMGRFKQVSGIMTTHTSTVYEVNVLNTSTLTVTGNHPLYVRTKRLGRSTGLGEPGWKSVASLDPMVDYVGIPVNEDDDIPRIHRLPTATGAFWWLVGRWMAAGSLSGDSLQFTPERDMDHLQEVSDHLDRCRIPYTVEKKAEGYLLTTEPNADLAGYLRSFGGTGPLDGRLPREILRLPVKLCKELIDGIFSADRLGGCRPLSRAEALSLARLVNKAYHQPVSLIQQPGGCYEFGVPSSDWVYEDGMIWAAVNKVEPRAEERDMYNLTVLDDSSYVANGVAAHNCGLCVSPSAVTDFLPTSMELDEESGEKSLTSQVIMTEVEELGLIKMDLLGLRNMGVIHEVEDAVVRNYGLDAALRQIGSDGPAFSYQNIPLTDRDTYRFLRDGLTGGVFQMESAGITKVIVQLLENVDTLPDERMGECFERLIAAVALYRPGPMDNIPQYVEGIRNPSTTHYLAQEEEDILKTTYGVIVYQEQVMQLVQKLAGYSLGRADVVRKGMAKKKQKILDAEQKVFIHGNREEFESGKDEKYAPGCVANGIKEEVATAIWNQMAEFGRYAFNRSHAACYAYIAYITAYMSCHWPSEFYAAMLNAFLGNADKTKNYLAQTERRGIQLLIPDIQKSQCRFSATRDGILFGLQGIKGIKATAAHIVEEREKNGPFRDLQDLYERLKEDGFDLDKTGSEGLVFSGALNGFSDNKAALLAQYELIRKDYKSNGASRAMGQYTLFSPEEMKIAMPDTHPFSSSYEMEKEQEVLGMFVSMHPTDLYADKLPIHPEITPMDRLVQLVPPIRTVRTLALVRGVRVFFNKQARQMASFTAESKYASIPCVVFPDAMEQVEPLLKDNTILVIEGSLARDYRNEEPQISVRALSDPDFALKDPVAPYLVDIRNLAEQTAVLHFIQSHPGEAPVVLLACGREFHIHSRVMVSPETEAFFAQFNSRPPLPPPV